MECRCRGIIIWWCVNFYSYLLEEKIDRLISGGVDDDGVLECYLIIGRAVFYTQTLYLFYLRQMKERHYNLSIIFLFYLCLQFYPSFSNFAFSYNEEPLQLSLCCRSRRFWQSVESREKEDKEAVCYEGDEQS